MTIKLGEQRYKKNNAQAITDDVIAKRVELRLVDYLTRTERCLNQLNRLLATAPGGKGEVLSILTIRGMDVEVLKMIRMINDFYVLHKVSQDPIHEIPLQDSDR